MAYLIHYNKDMATTPNTAGTHSGTPSVHTLNQIARMVFNHVMDSYGIGTADRSHYDRPVVVEHWNGPDQHAIVWEFEINGESFIYRLHDLTFAGYLLEPYNHYAIAVYCDD